MSCSKLYPPNLVVSFRAGAKQIKQGELYTRHSPIGGRLLEVLQLILTAWAVPGLLFCKEMSTAKLFLGQLALLG